MRAVFEKFSHGKMSEDEEIPPGSYSVEQILGEKNDPQSSKAAACQACGWQAEIDPGSAASVHARRRGERSFEHRRAKSGGCDDYDIRKTGIVR